MGGKVFRSWQVTAASAVASLFWTGLAVGWVFILAGLEHMSINASVAAGAIAAMRSLRVRLVIGSNQIKVVNYFRSVTVGPEDVIEVGVKEMLMGVMWIGGLQPAVGIRTASMEKAFPIQASVGIRRPKRQALLQALLDATKFLDRGGKLAPELETYRTRRRWGAFNAG